MKFTMLALTLILGTSFTSAFAKSYEGKVEFSLHWRQSYGVEENAKLGAFILAQEACEQATNSTCGVYKIKVEQVKSGDTIFVAKALAAPIKTKK